MNDTCKIYYCYKATNQINGKVYIGFATDPHKRWSQHKRDAARGKGYVFHAAIRKYGWHNFKFEILCCGKDKTAMLGYVEPQLIEQYQSRITQHGYNVLRGGERMHFVPYDKISRAQAISKAKKGRSNGLIGTTKSETTRRKMSEVRIGMKFTDEHRANLSKSHMGLPSNWAGHHHTEKSRKKLSDALVGVPRAAKSWIVIHPDGHSENIVNMTQFCEAHGLSKGLMSQVAHGKAKHHKKFVCQKIH